ncbi:hypothetical protein ACFXAS_12655 [Streptomyces sp. NPDC059459]|uniref:hypothetical protein n=1 Tax=Streptomyces sp. NPDC059459 TaxID=3346839 RepID=UPI0036C680D0
MAGAEDAGGDLTAGRTVVAARWLLPPGRGPADILLLLAVVTSVAATNAVPSSVPGAAASAADMGACCVWAGPGRTGWAHRGQPGRLRRA